MVPIREDGEDMRVHAALGDIVYSLTREYLIEKGWITSAKVYYLHPEFNMESKYLDFQTTYNTQVVNNDNRNNLAIKSAVKECKAGRKVLVLVNKIEHGELLLKKLTELLPNYKVIFMNGKSKNRDQDMNQFNIIIATSIYDEGYDLPSLDCLILAGGGKSILKLTQRIGRVLRLKEGKKYAVIYDFVDNIKYLKKHYLLRRAELESSFEVYDVKNVNDSQLDQFIEEEKEK